MKDFYDTANYLSGQTRYPEGSVAQVLNSRPQSTREIFQAIKQRMDTPRDLPFEQKRTPGEWADKLGFDAETATRINDSLDGSEVMATLQSRMGTAAQDGPPTLRDQIAAATDYHVGE